MRPTKAYLFLYDTLGDGNRFLDWAGSSVRFAANKPKAMIRDRKTGSDSMTT